VPVTGVQDGGSLAGKLSSDAVWTGLARCLARRFTDAGFRICGRRRADPSCPIVAAISVAKHPPTIGTLSRGKTIGAAIAAMPS
jgi:hypothetical protein